MFEPMLLRKKQQYAVNNCQNLAILPNIYISRLVDDVDWIIRWYDLTASRSAMKRTIESINRAFREAHA
jgi:hypothetical protein